jgi:hypothetical protein
MIESRIVADSIYGKHRLTTFEVSFPRWILAEFNTHRVLSRNSASSRAIPIKANIENILADTAIPVHWGLNQPGMVADKEVETNVSEKAKEIWLKARDAAIQYATELSDLGIHKQIANRLIENFTYQKVIVTATEWDNFFWLRNHKDAQPEIKALAELMLKHYNESVPTILNVGEWHVPYVLTSRGDDGVLNYQDIDGEWLDVETALKISASCCAQVSYRKQDSSIEKALKVFDMLNLSAGTDINDARKHSSPIEHQATPIHVPTDGAVPTYITHFNSKLNLCSGNFVGWGQYRHHFDNESCKDNPEVSKHGEA